MLGACQPNTTYYMYQPVSSKGWNRTDTLIFNLPDSLTFGTYKLGIGIRHTGKYPYRDLWLELSQLTPDEKAEGKWKEKKDTLHLYLANKQGNWMGSGTTSGHFQLLLDCGEFTLPEDSITTGTMQANEGISSKKKKKYTFVGQRKAIGKQSKFQVKVTHIMTDSILHHISDVGILLKK